MTSNRYASSWIFALGVVSAISGTLISGSSLQSAEPAALPKGLTITSLEAFPDQLQLVGPLAYRQLLLTGITADGQRVDLTRHAQLRGKPAAVKVSPQGLVEVVADGQESLRFAFEDHEIEIPVTVTESQTRPKISFLQDVQPALSRMSCNSGTCHGSKDGKDGFKLSLRGYDALYDHRALTDDVGARRFNRAAPEQSLMLLKASGSIPHVGGVRTKTGSRYYEIVRRWIGSGAALDLDSPRVTSIRVLPKNPIVPRAGWKQQMVVLATFADGKVRDVTHEAFVESGNIEVVDAEEGGLLHLLRRGEAPVLVRYEGAYAATTLTVMGDREGFQWEPPPENNYVDKFVYQKLQRVKVLPSELCSDDVFVRRLYLDLTGLPPTADQVRQFLNDQRPQQEKRNALIDELVGNAEFIEHWTNKWADLLQVNRKFLGEEGAVTLRDWIKQAVASNMPYDQFARAVLTASGSNIENPPASYFKRLRDPADLMENTTHLFLAVRFNCNKCHDHPFERWTQDQYYQLSAYFAQVKIKPDPAFAGQKIGGSAVEGAKPLVEVIYDTRAGEVTHDRTGQVTPPAFPYQHADPPPADASRRAQLAHWITSPENQYFARSYVNRLWGYLLGTGIIEPIDDIRAGNPPTNPELLDALTEHFVKSGFDSREMLRTICKSRTYQHAVTSNRWNEDDEINYSHALPRRLPAEVLYDAIHVSTGSIQRIPGVPAGFRAAELPDVGIRLPFLDDFGRPVRESSCECERSTGMVLGPVMKLINGPTVGNAIADPQNALAKLVAEQPDDRKVIEELFLRFLARFPTEREVKLGLDAIARSTEGHDELVAELAEYEKTVPAKQAAWEQRMLGDVSWTPLKPIELKSAVGGEFQVADDLSVSVSGKLAKDLYTIVLETDLPKITGIRLEAINDKGLPAGGPGRAQNGNFVISELKLSGGAKGDPAGQQPIALGNPTADFSQDSWPVKNAIDGDSTTGWAVSPQFNKTHTAVFPTKEAVIREGGSRLTITLDQQFPDGAHLLGKFRISVTSDEQPQYRVSDPKLTALLSVPQDKRTDEQKTQIRDLYRATDTQWQQLAEVVKKSEELVKQPRLLGVQDLAWALINNPSFLFNR